MAIDLSLARDIAGRQSDHAGNIELPSQFRPHPYMLHKVSKLDGRSIKCTEGVPGGY